MASYEKSSDLQDYVNKNIQIINRLIQDLPDISKFEDVIDDISDVSTFIGTLASDTNKKVNNDLDKKIKDLSDCLSGIKENITNLKGNVVTLRSELITRESDKDIKSYSKEQFLVDEFPIISD